MTSPPHEGEVTDGEWGAGWKIVAAGACGVGTTWTLFQITAGLFVIPMQADFGWSRTSLAIGPVGGLICALFFPLAGALIDRYGPRRMAIIGTILFSIGLLMFAVAPPRPLIFYSILLYTSIVGSVASAVVFAKGVTTWFTRRLGTALGFTMTGASITSAIAIPLLSSLIAHHGWRTGFLGLAGIVLFIGLPVILLWFRVRSDVHKRPDLAPGMDGISVGQAVKDKRFWLLIISFGVAGVAIGGFLTHLQPILVGLGISRSSAATFGSIFVISIGIGRMIIGSLLDRAYPPLVAGGSLFFSGLGALQLALLNVNEIRMFAVGIAVSMVGLAQGAESDYQAFFTMRIFGERSFSRLFGIIASVMASSMAVGGILFAALFDHYGDYHLAMWGSVATFFLAALLLSMVNVPSLPDIEGNRMQRISEKHVPIGVHDEHIKAVKILDLGA